MHVLGMLLQWISGKHTPMHPLMHAGGPLRSTSGLLGDSVPGKLTPQWLLDASKNSALVVGSLSIGPCRWGRQEHAYE